MISAVFLSKKNQEYKFWNHARVNDTINGLSGIIKYYFKNKIKISIYYPPSTA
ncbi:MAG: hypothetical protein V1747_08330 [Candidatus Omnitrophota bacterium]